jgi:transcriptional regulator with XRE-family HTH domain
MEGVIMTAKKATKKHDALDQLIHKFVGGDPERQAMLDEEIVNVEAAQLVYDLRRKAGLSQRELAKKVGTTASVICRMEQADYESSLPMLRRIAGALNRRLESFVRFRLSHPLPGKSQRLVNNRLLNPPSGDPRHAAWGQVRPYPSSSSPCAGAGIGYCRSMTGVKKLDLDDPAPILEDDEDEETLAAIDEGIRDAEAGRTLPIEEVRKLLPQWITTASSSRKGR